MNEQEDKGIELQAHVRRLKRLAWHVWKHFQEDRCLEEAASLSYTSLLAMVPLLAVIFGVIAAFPVFSEWSGQLQSFIFTNFVPAAGEQIEAYINTFLGSISSLTLPGTITLFVTALLLMVRIEVALNRIWRVTESRTLINRIVMYWAVLTLAPLLTGAAVALSAQKVFGALGLEGGMTPGWHRLGVFALTWAVFTVMFILVPNRRVRIRDAVIGAFLSAALFELAKAGFVAYVSNANYSVIYGALATVPIFLFWLYLVWNVVLFGASLAASLTTFRDQVRSEGNWPQKWEFLMVYRLIGHLWEAQRKGESQSTLQLLERESRVGELQIQRLLRGLQEAEIIAREQGAGWILSRDIEEFSFKDLYGSGNYHLPLSEPGDLPTDSEWDRSFVRSIGEIHANGLNVLDCPLRTMYRMKAG
jgi:membrane protein